jgi:hypothetical protein
MAQLENYQSCGKLRCKINEAAIFVYARHFHVSSLSLPRLRTVFLASCLGGWRCGVACSRLLFKLSDVKQFKRRRNERRQNGAYVASGKGKFWRIWPNLVS